MLCNITVETQHCFTNECALREEDLLFNEEKT